MLGAKYDFSRDRERRAGFDDMVIFNKNLNDKLFHRKYLFVLGFYA